MCTNAEDVHLLFEDPGKLILQYEPMIRTIVQMQISKGEIAHYEKDEVAHYVIDELFNRTEKIRQQYNGQALLKTYCAAVVRNLCKEWLRIKRRDHVSSHVKETATDPYGGLNPLNQTLIQDEMRYFDRVLLIFGPVKAKLVLFLKAYYRLPLLRGDFLAYHPGMTEPDIQHYQGLLKNDRKARDHDIYKALFELVRRFEYRKNSPDAVRKWLKARILDLVNLMNYSRETTYETETLQILAEHFFMNGYSEEASINASPRVLKSETDAKSKTYRTT